MQAGGKVILDLASWEIVEKHFSSLCRLIESGVHAVCCNEDEAQSFQRCLAAQRQPSQSADTGSGAAGALPTARSSDTPARGIAGAERVQGAGPAELPAGSVRQTGALQDDNLRAIEGVQAYLLQHCDVAVVTLGARGCVARRRGGSALQQPAERVETVRDTTGAGDLFVAGFTAGLLQGATLQECCRIGCACGAAAVQVGPGSTHVSASQGSGKLAVQTGVDCVCACCSTS